jgi:3-methyladenine DNA glycosylase/8-oxoguanine DNA glycosylase
MLPRCHFNIPILPGFDLARAVCSYGYFLLAPNRWDVRTQRLHRPLRGTRGRIIQVTLAQAPAARGLAPKGRERAATLRISCDKQITKQDRALLTEQISRMLRLDEPAENFRAWHKLYPEARQQKFGRLFRSPTLFEDLVKTMTGCNVTWRNTMSMNRLLCEKVGPPGIAGSGAFPTPAELAAVRPDWLKRHCKVGYRAGRIVRLARDVTSGRLDLTPFEDAALSTDEIFDRLLSIHGIGEYAAGNMCQLLGRYDRLAIDTETYRHFEQAHNLPRGKNPKLIHPRIEAHYAKYKPYQFLAYWFDLWKDYQKRFGRSWEWDAEKHGPNFTAARLK